MKLKSLLICGTLALTISNSFAVERVFDITGATAFRASANTALIALLGGSGTTTYAYIGSSGASGTNRALYKGTMAAFPGDTIVVRCNWSGSTQGILDVADDVAIQFLDKDANATSTAGTLLASPVYTTAVAQWSFSDVDKSLSTRPNHAFAGGAVGIVPFMFLAGEGAPAEFTNMSDQLHAALWSTGQLPIALFTGNTADLTTVLATGRNNGSGTRALILSETAYGSFTNVVQFNATFAGTRTDAYPTGKLLAVSEFGNDGHSSNSGVRDVLTRRSDDLTFNGDAIDALFVSYLTISDANSAVTEGAKALTYNGVAFSVENVKKGLYTLWGYQQFYKDNDTTAEQDTFDTAFRTALPSSLVEPNAIAITNMSVVRSGQDGGPIAPGNNYPAANP